MSLSFVDSLRVTERRTGFELAMQLERIEKKMGIVFDPKRSNTFEDRLTIIERTLRVSEEQKKKTEVNRHTDKSNKLTKANDDVAMMHTSTTSALLGSMQTKSQSNFFSSKVGSSCDHSGSSNDHSSSGPSSSSQD